MDLSTVKKKISANKYTSLEAFMQDVELIRSNCYAYNQNIPQNFGLVPHEATNARALAGCPQLPLADTFVADVKALVEYFNDGEEEDDMDEDSD
eukprot:scaffold1722_cov380-Prasinococcus_capsulatus_cf.AAC.12